MTAGAKERFYSQRYASWKDTIREYRLRVIISMLPPPEKMRVVLDVGCGDGAFASFIGEIVGDTELYGLDIAPEAAAKACARGVRALALDLDEEVLPFDENTFDVVICGEVIEHLYDPDHLLEEIHRVLKPDGICIITTPNLASWYNRIALLFGFQPFWTEVSLFYNVGKLFRGGCGSGNGLSGHIRNFVPRALKELLRIHRFELLKVRGAHQCANFPLWLRPVERVLTVLPELSSNVIVACRPVK